MSYYAHFVALHSDGTPMRDDNLTACGVELPWKDVPPMAFDPYQTTCERCRRTAAWKSLTYMFEAVEKSGIDFYLGALEDNNVTLLYLASVAKAMYEARERALVGT